MRERYECNACAHIDMSALSHNFILAGRLSGGREIIPVIKANAYGHGSVEVASYLTENLGAKKLAVARVNEGIEIRAGQINSSIIILGGFYEDEIQELIHYNLEPSVYDMPLLCLLDKKAAAAKKIIKVHLKINTGMNRLGVKPEKAPGFINFIRNSNFLKLESVYTHFADADLANDKRTKKQSLILESLKKAAGPDVLFHAANSAAILKYPFAHFDAVRPGIMMYGSYCDKKTAKSLLPVMTLKTSVAQVIGLKSGDKVSYGGRYTARKKEYAAVISIGYGDGFPRSLSGKGEVMINGKKRKVLGTVCMDLTVVQADKNVKQGDAVLVFGRDGKNIMPIEKMAEDAGTIAYEILTGISDRVKRIYKY
ncbi:MAG: alanine racemase [Candidatus Goldiibacteriota bacterium HGW-Goldbacteria-1]|nr:MAG: alanine racemase [Candidatus Goldiibacteriota bacterium HGW-Goldbacteria-1]